MQLYCKVGMCEGKDVFRHTEFELLSTADMKCLAEYRYAVC